MEFTRVDDRFFMNGTEFDLISTLNNTNIIYGYEYAEPGYSIPEGKYCILAGDWNEGNSGIELCKALNIDISNEKTVLEFLEKEFDLQWADEWAQCYECMKFVRTQPDDYSWSPSYAIQNGCELLCLECIDYPELLEEYINDANKAWNFDVKYLIDADFEKIDDSWHGGIREISENPRVVYKELKLKYPDNDIIFVIDTVEQFGVEFVAYKRKVSK